MTVTVLLLLLAAGLASLRLVRGPMAADRVVALDIFLATGSALSVAAALATRRHEFLDVGLGLALTGFVGTLAWARLIERAAEGPER
jgi:multicomponent Na+:H+ antiporter subunit F